MNRRNELTETDVRELRANIYGECTENNWSACRENWLIEHQPEGVEVWS